MDICLRVLKENNKSRFDSLSVRNKQRIAHIPYYLSGLSRAHFSDNLSRNSCIRTGLSTEGDLRFKGNFPRTSPRGAYIWRGDLT